METERPEGLVRKFGLRFYVFALMAFLAPLLADSLHSFFVVYVHFEIYGIGFYGSQLHNVELGRIACPGWWSFVVARGVISFVVIRVLAWRFRDLWIWCCLGGLWTWLDLHTESYIK
jgi:hypothetical protein